MFLVKLLLAAAGSDAVRVRAQATEHVWQRLFHVLGDCRALTRQFNKGAGCGMSAITPIHRQM